MEKLKLLLKNNPEIFIFLTLTIGVLFYYYLITNNNNKDVEFISLHYEQADKLLYGRIKNNNSCDSINLCRNLKTLFYYAGEVKQSKLHLAVKFQRYVVVCYTIGIFFLFLTAVIIFVISKKGWDVSSRARKSLFLCSIFYGSLLTTFPKLFDQEKNYQNNFNDYSQLSNCQLYTYQKLNKYFDRNNAKLSHLDSLELQNATDTVNKILMNCSNIILSVDRNQLEIAPIVLK